MHIIYYNDMRNPDYSDINTVLDQDQESLRSNKYLCLEDLDATNKEQIRLVKKRADDKRPRTPTNSQKDRELLILREFIEFMQQENSEG